MFKAQKSASPVEEHLRRKFRIFLDPLLSEGMNSGDVEAKIEGFIDTILTETPDVDPTLVRRIADEYLQGLKGQPHE